MNLKPVNNSLNLPRCIVEAMQINSNLYCQYMRDSRDPNSYWNVLPNRAKGIAQGYRLANRVLLDCFKHWPIS
jgi:hypothetical protein